MNRDRKEIILNVDDDEIKRYSITRLLVKHGFEVWEAASGQEALEKVRANPDLVVLDVNLPDINGFEVCARLKASEATAAIMVLHLTASFMQTQDKVHGLESGADAYLTQDVSPDELLATIRALLRLRHAEEKARSSAREWETTFHSISDAICIVNKEGRIERQNWAFSQMISLPESAISGRHLNDLFDEGLTAGIFDPAALRRCEGLAADFKWQGRTYACSINPIHLPSASCESWVCIWRDVTDERRVAEVLRQSEQELRKLAEAMPHIVWRADADGRLQYVNTPWCGIDNKPPFEPKNEWYSCFSAKDLPQLKQVWRDALKNKSSFAAEARLEQEGRLVWIKVRCVPDLDEEGRLREWIGTCSDMTYEKDLEQQLRQRLEELAESDRKKDEFLAVLAHELRNPLNAIKAALYLKKRQAAQADPGTEVIERQTSNLGRLVDDLLDVSRITRGKIELKNEDVDLGETVRRAVEAVSSAAQEKELEITLSLPPDTPAPVTGDSTRLEQATMNLLINAIKFTPKGGKIEVRVGCDQGQCTVEVQDNGIGIPSELLPSLFEPFVQADHSLDRALGGLGLGLTIVKKLIEMHGGKVEATSAGKNMGSVFRYSIPLRKAAATSAQNGCNQVAAVLKKLHILVVEDNEDTAHCTAEILTDAGHTADVAHDGEEALLAVQKRKPDVALLDIGLPKMDGLELAKRLKCHERFRDVRLIAISGYGQEHDKAKSSEAGFALHLTKPIDYDGLLDALARIVLHS